jgi:hypothetical protein
MASRVRDPEALHKVVSDAAQRLMDALAAEAKLERRLRLKRTEHKLFQQRRAVQRSIEQGAVNYTQATRRFRAAILALFLDHNRQNVAGRAGSSQGLRAQGFKSPR